MSSIFSEIILTVAKIQSVIDYIRALQKAEYFVKPLKGNHEDFLVSFMMRNCTLKKSGSSVSETSEKIMVCHWR